ncbi:MAG: carbohydrate-binding family 9-like protein [bacterium]
MMHYTINKINPAPLNVIDFSCAEEGRVECVRPESSTHHPETRFQVLHDGAVLYLKFCVKDAYVRSVQTEYQGPVYTDSCVEFFVQPVKGKGYFNFEINAGGTLLLTYIEDPTRVPGGFAKFTRVDVAWGKQVQIQTSLPRVVEPERAEDWSLRVRIPFALFEYYTGLKPENEWRGNVYKCGDSTSHPHWMAWSPVSVLNFHLPECFGSLSLR